MKSRRAIPCTFIVFLILFSFNFHKCAKPPIQEVVDAQMALEAARKAGAPELSPVEYTSAEDAIRKAIEYMNDKNFDLSAKNAVESKESAEAAIKRADGIKASKKEEGERRRKERETKIEAAVEAAMPEKTPKEQILALISDGRLLTTDTRIIPDDKLILKRIYFDYKSVDLNEDAKSTIKANARWLKQYSDAMVQLEGHCDEKASRKYNLAMGEQRAQAVKDYLMGLGINPSLISINSFGEKDPLDPRDNEEAWAINRRVQFAVLPTENILTLISRIPEEFYQNPYLMRVN